MPDPVCIKYVLIIRKVNMIIIKNILYYACSARSTRRLQIRFTHYFANFNVEKNVRVFF
jgi:hypothetical protein